MIADGLKQEQFLAFFQGKTDLSTGKLIGAEVLCRWKHPQKAGLLQVTLFPSQKKPA